MKLINKFRDVLKKGKGKAGTDPEKYLDRADNGPGKAKNSLKLAQFYEKKGETEKALKEYLLTAASFSRNAQYPQALAIYKHILKQNPNLDKIALKIAEIYGKMGQVENAYAVYGQLLRMYNNQGKESKAAEVMCLMAELSIDKIAIGKQTQAPAEESHISEKIGGNPTGGNTQQNLPSGAENTGISFDLEAELKTNQPLELKSFSKVIAGKIYGFKEIFEELKTANIPSTAFPDFNFHMGVACRQMACIDEAIEQFKIALKKRQNPCEAAHMLGRCFQDKGLGEEARHLFEEALKVEGIPREKIREIKNDLALIAGHSTGCR